MMPDIFSTFDPMAFSNLMPVTMTLSISIMLTMMTQMSFWLKNNRMSILSMSSMMIIYQQLARTFSSNIKGLNTSLCSFFCLIIMINLLGLNPYSISLSSHLVFTLLLGLPMWMSMIISSALFNPKATIAHLLPDGAPTWLNPFLIMIETTSISVRPLTLSFRLAANMSAGHIVLSLINIYASTLFVNGSSIGYSLILLSLFYILFEVAICLIQAYIFCLLLSLYSDDHAH